MKKALTIVAASALALGAAACSKSPDNSSANVSSEDNMLVSADENSMGSDMNAGVAADNAVVDNGSNETNSANAM